ncbi:hypothetical protein [Devosia sp.]|uniref:hypothetical protein n=1 Tax=Devosia sp. TaxID=1871048 RepID=UPI003A946527
MTAGLLYIFGFVAIVITAVLAGAAAPAVYDAYRAGMQRADADALTVLLAVSNQLSWAIGPFVGGLLMMGMGRVIFLLGAINRSLRG